MKSGTAVSIRWFAAALLPATALVLAAGAADEPEKKPAEKRPAVRQERRSEPRQPRTEQRTPQAAPADTPPRTPGTERRRRIESQPATRPAENAPIRVQPRPAQQERRPAPVYPTAVPPERRPDRRPPPARNVEVIRHPAGDRNISRTSMGTRTVVVERPGRIVVSQAPSRGYVQRPVVIANTSYVHRTYVRNDVVVSRVYRPYAYRGVTFAVYTPVRYYPAPFYAWAYSPWRTPVRYTWGWYNDPWYGYYRGYYSPYPVYSSPTLWLTDYLIASTLQAAYMERMAERRATDMSYPAGGVPLSAEVKQAIATEVQQQIQYERNEAQYQGTAQTSGLPPSLADNRRHLFVVDRGIDVPNLSMGGQMCAISEGDVLQMDGPAPGDSDAASVVVVSAKPGSCMRGSAVSVYLSDLSEMQNHLRETVGQGMEELRAKQGQGGLPLLPANAASAPVAASFTSQLPPPDPGAATEVQQQYADPPAAESPVAPQGTTGVIPVYGGPAPATRISAGQSIEQVIAILGEPKSIADLGSKKVYVFQDLKVTFVDGRVADVQ